MFKPNCIYCHKKLQKNDSTVQFSRSNIWHENCYREHLEKNIQNVWLREKRLLKKVKISLNKVRKQILSLGILDLDFSKFSKDFEFNMVSLKSITDTCKGLDNIQKDKLEKFLEKYFKKMMILLKSYNKLLKQYSDSKTGLTLEQFKEKNKVLENQREEWIELADYLMSVHNTLKSFENKTKIKIGEEIKKQINEIPKRVKRF
ncbi:hypothetical protein MUO71_06995 [Candidatus Bathyarchaeota archaeon]|nr:hypothetical protein [Candidatus Bathyarchaeota archaeon]